MKSKSIKQSHHTGIRLTTLGVCLGATVAGIGSLHAQTADAGRLEKLEQENADLKKRLDTLEAVAQKEGILTDGGAANKTLTFLGGSTLSGFVTSSYFYDMSNPPDNVSHGYLWSRNDGSFAINKVELKLARPAVVSGDKWDAGYNVIMIWGQDAQFVNTGPSSIKGFDSLRQAFVELNVPIGNGLDVKAGQLISLLNFESGDGGAANPNFSQGNQWFFTGNGPAAGVQASYTFNPVIDFSARVQNGLFTGAIDGNGYKTLMGSLGIKPDDKTGINLIGFGGREGSSTSEWLKGGSVIASRKLADTYGLTAATEFDYFSADTAGGSADWWSIGGWLWADFTPSFGAALRGDYINDEKGAGTSGLLGFPVNSGQELFSLTGTLNFHPLASIKIQPEVRYEHTTLEGAFGGHKDRVILGMGASYLF